MNYLALCKRVDLILRIGTETPGTQPTTVAGQSGTNAEIVQWVAASHDDICRMRTDWAFMRASGNFSLPTADRLITKAEMIAAYATFGKINPFVGSDGAYLGITPTGVAGAAEGVVEYVPWQHWQGNYDAAPLSTGMPTHFTVAPDQGLEFNALADRDYTIRANFRKKVVPLAADGDLPMFDDDYHGVIAWHAVVHYYCPSRDKTMELRQKADIVYRRELTKMVNEQTPDFTVY